MGLNLNLKHEVIYKNYVQILHVRVIFIHPPPQKEQQKKIISQLKDNINKTTLESDEMRHISALKCAKSECNNKNQYQEGYTDVWHTQYVSYLG